MPIYALNGILLADGASLRGCCCGSEPPTGNCALVQVDLYVSRENIPSGSAAGGGSHSSLAEVRQGICSSNIISSRSGSTWSAFTAASSATSNSCSATGCGQVSATTYNSGSWMTLRIPFARGNVRTAVGFFRYADTKVVMTGYKVEIAWTCSVKFFAQNGGAPTPQTQKPNVQIVFTTGENLSTNGVDKTWDAFKVSTAYGGQTLQNFDATVYFT